MLRAAEAFFITTTATTTVTTTTTTIAIVHTIHTQSNIHTFIKKYIHMLWLIDYLTNSNTAGFSSSRFFIRSRIAVMIEVALSSPPCLELFSAAPAVNVGMETTRNEEDKAKTAADASRQ